MTINIEDRIRRWIDLWNTDPFRMVDECYVEDCQGLSMLQGTEIKGREAVREIERRILAADSNRRAEISKVIVSGREAAVELVITMKGVAANVGVFVTFDDQGLIISDRSYSRGGF
jgi:hypothetical protein